MGEQIIRASIPIANRVPTPGPNNESPAQQPGFLFLLISSAGVNGDEEQVDCRANRASMSVRGTKQTNTMRLCQVSN
jgi:hypothetical protein